MTTEVIVKANHGWPVQISPLTPNGTMAGPQVTVEPGSEWRGSVHSGQDLHIHEVQPQASDLPHDPATGAMLAFFSWDHLPPQLAIVSSPFAAMAARIVNLLPASAERTACLRKLLEAKDCAVRAASARSK